jgi:hypothetical protein
MRTFPNLYIYHKLHLIHFFRFFIFGTIKHKGWYVYFSEFVYLTLNGGFLNSREDYRSFLFFIIIKRSFLPSDFIYVYVCTYVIKIDRTAKSFIVDHNRSVCTNTNVSVASSDDRNRNKKFWEELIAYIPLYDTGRIENDVSNNSYIAACVFITAVKFLPSRCLATIRGIHIQTQTDGGDISIRPLRWAQVP